MYLFWVSAVHLKFIYLKFFPCIPLSFQGILFCIFTVIMMLYTSFWLLSQYWNILRIYLPHHRSEPSNPLRLLHDVCAHRQCEAEYEDHRRGCEGAFVCPRPPPTHGRAVPRAHCAVDQEPQRDLEEHHLRVRFWSWHRCGRCQRCLELQLCRLLHAGTTSSMSSRVQRRSWKWGCRDTMLCASWASTHLSGS